MAMQAEEERLKNKGHKYLATANPSTRDNLFAIIYGLKWDNNTMGYMIKDKLYNLCSVRIASDKYFL